MAYSLRTVLPTDIVERIEAYVPREVELEWSTVYGSTTIYSTKHVITYGGAPEGGYVYFYREHEPGWYRWHRNWGVAPIYTKVDGLLVQMFDNDAEYVAEVPYNFEYDGEEEITILDKWVMEQDT